jgi:hypothetical protein
MQDIYNCHAHLPKMIYAMHARSNGTIMLNVFLSKFKCDCRIPQRHMTELTSRHDEKPDWDKEISAAKGHLRASSFLSEVWLG